jgi:RND family efflux transporter MFP subunit
LAILVALGTLGYLGFVPFTKSEIKQQRGTDKLRPLTVKVTKVRVGDIEEKITAVGSVMANASVIVAPKMAGRIENILVEVGDRVNKGELVVRLDRRELEEEVREAQASLKVSQATLKGKEAELEDLRRKLKRAETLAGKNFISRQEVDTLESQVQSAMAEVELTKAQIAQMTARVDNARIRLAETRVPSPFAGYVGRRHVDPGAMVNPATPIVSIVDISRVKVVLPVVEKDYGKIRPGSPANLTVDAYPGREFSGKVARLSPVLNQDTRTAEVEVELPNPQELLKPGMFAKVEIVTEKRQNVLLVPDVALVKANKGHAVYRIAKGESVELVSVKPGVSDKGWVEVKGSLNPGDPIVTLGSSLLKDGQRVVVTATGGGA